MARVAKFKRKKKSVNYQVAIDLDSIAFIELVVEDEGEVTKVFFRTADKDFLVCITLDEKFDDVFAAMSGT